MNRKWISFWLSAGLLGALLSCQGGKIICRTGPETSAAGRGSVNLVWDSIPDPVEGYKIYYGTSPGKYRNCVDIGKGAESPPGTSQYILTGLAKGTKYFIAVAAYSNYGGFFKQSDLSHEISAVAK